MRNSEKRKVERMVCSRCKKNLPEGTTFCNYCGYKIMMQPDNQTVKGKPMLSTKWIIGIVAVVLLIGVMVILFSGGSKLDGTWKGGKDNGETITFDDGKFVTSGYKNEHTGTYTINGNQLTMINEGGEERTYSFELVGDSLVLTYQTGDYEYNETYIKQ